MRAALRLLAVAALLCSTALTACSKDPDDSTRPVAGTTRYVALGDSYTAAPGVPETSSDECLQSTNNYPHLIAAADDDIVEVVDVSCGGAGSIDLLRGQDKPGGRLPPQVDAVTDDTDLVTVGIGANDLGISSIVLYTCSRVAHTDPSGAPCLAATGAKARYALARAEDLIGRALDVVQQKAPDARVVVVSYPQVVPTSGATCPDRVAFAAGDYPYIDAVITQLNNALHRAAHSHGAMYADVYAASEGHDICADEPWVNGGRVADDGTYPLHPLLAGQEGAARVIEDLL